MAKNTVLSTRTEYVTLLVAIKERIRSAQYEALRAVNKGMISLYWDIGKMIVEKQKGKTWGKGIVENLAKDLQVEFPGIRGFSSQNLWRMKQFYETYASKEKLSPMVREIGWTQNIIILMNCKDDLEREFYIRMTQKFGWTKNVLAVKKSIIVRAGAMPITVDRLISQLTEKLLKPIERNKRSV